MNMLWNIWKNKWNLRKRRKQEKSPINSYWPIANNTRSGKATKPHSMNSHPGSA